MRCGSGHMAECLRNRLSSHNFYYFTAYPGRQGMSLLFLVVSEYLKTKWVHEYVFTRSCLVEVKTVVLIELHFFFLLLE